MADWTLEEKIHPNWYSEPRMNILDKNCESYAPFVNRKISEILSDELRKKGTIGLPSTAQIEQAEAILMNHCGGLTTPGAIIAPIIEETRKTVHQETAPLLEQHLKKVKKHRMFYRIPSEEWAINLPESNDNGRQWVWRPWLVLENMIEDPHAENRPGAKSQIKEFISFACMNYRDFLKDTTVAAYGKLFDMLGKKGGEVMLGADAWKQLEGQVASSAKIVPFEYRGRAANFMVKWEDGEPVCYVSEQGISIMEGAANWQVGMDPEGYMAHPTVQGEIDKARRSGSGSERFFTLFKHILNEEKTWVVGESRELQQVFKEAHEKAEQRLLARFPQMLVEFKDRLVELVRSAAA